MKKKTQKVVLALSGGVDSSLAAAWLKEQGYEVIGAFMKNWTDSQTMRGECPWQEDRRDAVRVAAFLNIPLVTFDFEKEYRQQVAEYIFREYEAGRTPNPDVLCNSEVKFPLFWREAKKKGADLIATGHHVRVKKKGSGWQLLAGKDKEKDQSYFLHRLTQDDLSHTLFPIGEYTKDRVRKMARRLGLPTADRRSTRGICFVGRVSMPKFLGQVIKEKPGMVKTTSGEVVGKHQGLAPFTVGQRHGFGVGGGVVYYVVEKDVETNTLVVGGKNDPGLWKKELWLNDVHWISGQPRLPLKCRARIRYRGELMPAKVSVLDSRFLVVFNKPVWAPAPGQFVVCYDGEVCLGGGVIE